MGRRFHYPSGRVIAVGRLLQASLFLLAIVLDRTNPVEATSGTYALLSGYVLFAAAVAIATWSNWWLDARLAGPAHAVDILMFTVLVLATEGYTSPFFAFFVFLLLAAAIRWSWLATALTATLLAALYLIAGLMVTQSGGTFQLQWFVIRTGHLAILSLILIWFGATQWRARFYRRDQSSFARTVLEDSPIETGLRAAIGAMRASAGRFLWRSKDAGEFTGCAIHGGTAEQVSVPGRALTRALKMRTFLYDFGEDRALMRDSKRNLPGFRPSEIIEPQWVSRLGLDEGIAIMVRSEEGEGAIFLDGVRSLSVDHLDLGEQIAADIAAHIQRHELVKRTDESAEARSRLSIARDLHDSVVQFLAGAAFRLEAMKRSEASGRPLTEELNELKQLMLHEQRELRGFIDALRSGSQVALDDLAGDLRELADRLSRQWDVRCEFSARTAELMVPTRLHLNVHQLMREAVANAVRHAEATSVKVALAVAQERLQLEFVNNGAPFPASNGRTVTPTSLQERVEQAGGELEVSRGMGFTKVSIALPIDGPAR